MLARMETTDPVAMLSVSQGIPPLNADLSMMQRDEENDSEEEDDEYSEGGRGAGLI